MPKRLERSCTNRVWSGVCGGIGEYLDVDPTLVRVFFVIAAIFSGGLFFLVYVALILVMPPCRPAAGVATPGDATAPITPVPPAPPDPEAAQRRRAWIGWFLVAVGAVFALNEFGAFRLVDWRYIWPLALIGLGALLLTRRVQP